MAGSGNVKAEVCYNNAMSEKQMAKVSDIVGNVGLVFFASVFLDPILKGSADLKVIAIGLGFAFVGWLVSIFMI